MSMSIASPLIDAMLTLKETLALNDWGYYQLAQEAGLSEYIAFVQSLYDRAEIVISEDVLAADDLF